MTFADKVKFVRDKLQISQERLSVILGVSFATVNRWENGRSTPNYKILEKFNQLCKENDIHFGD